MKPLASAIRDSRVRDLIEHLATFSQAQLPARLDSDSIAGLVNAGNAFPLLSRLVLEVIAIPDLDRSDQESREGPPEAVETIVTFLDLWRDGRAEGESARWLIRVGIVLLAIGRTLRESPEPYELAVEYLEHALGLLSAQADRVRWSMTLCIVGSATRERPTGDRSENVKKALTYCDEACRHLDRSRDLTQWSFCQATLASVYESGLVGDKDESLERAIEVGTIAETILVETRWPLLWARLQTTIGRAHRRVRSGDIGEHVEIAIRRFSGALRVLTRELFGREWAEIHIELARLYVRRRGGLRRSSIVGGIECIDRALRVYEEASLWPELAGGLVSMGELYLRLGSEENSIEKAVNCFETAAEIYRIGGDRLGWRRAQLLLAVAYGRLSRRGSKELEDKSLHHRKLAFEVQQGDNPELLLDLRALEALYGELGKVEGQER